MLCKFFKAFLSLGVKLVFFFFDLVCGFNRSLVTCVVKVFTLGFKERGGNASDLGLYFF